MMQIQVRTNWECYSQQGNESIDLVAINSSKKELELFDGDAPPIDSGALAYIVHNVIQYNKSSHITEYLLKLFPTGKDSVTMSRSQVWLLIEWCSKLENDAYSPAYYDNYCARTNSKTSRMLNWLLSNFNDEWYDGERHQFIVSKK
jgi:hypothetical protein